MKMIKICLPIFSSALILGCQSRVRSISNSSYEASANHSAYLGPEKVSTILHYQGELSEFDVLGVTRGQGTSETEIRRTLEQARAVKLRPGSSILLIQSGAEFPDGVILEELSKHFKAVPFSGVPAQLTSTTPLDYGSGSAESYAKSLRLAAARGGNDCIVCYWGVLESESERLATKTISWIPGANWIIPDETEHIRIKLKFAVIDVATGNWSIFSPKQIEQARSSVSPRRGVADQKMVEELKKQAYHEAVTELLRLHGEVALGK